MKSTVTFGHILTILAIIIIPLFIWGVNVETRFEKTIDNSESINEIKKDVLKLEEKDVKMKDLIQKNQIEVIKGISELKVLIEKRKP